MLDFRTRTPRNYFSRRERRRLLLWLGGIGLAVIACNLVAGARHMERMPLASEPAQVDTRFQGSPADKNQPGVVSIERQKAPAAENEDIPTHVKADLLAEVRDDTPWIRSAEVDAWLNLWSALKHANPRELARASLGDVGFVDLFQQPQAYRGKLVHFRGVARQATYVDAAENAAGIKGYHRLVLQPFSGPAEPVFLYVLDLPADFPTGDRIHEDVHADAFLFKRMVYPARKEGDLRRAPVLMAKNIDWRPAATDEASQAIAGAGRLVVGGVVAGVVLLIFVGLWSTHTRVRAYNPRPADLSKLDLHDVKTVSESLDELAETDQ
jgi:hypothetical protein